MCPGRQTDPARQNLIRQFVSDGLKPTRPFRFSLATRVRHVGRDPRLIAHKQRWSQSRSSFFNDRHAGAPPITAPFFFESKTAGLIFVRRCWPQGYWLFSWFPREDAAADYPCSHERPENPELYQLHCGVLRRLTPLRAIIRPSAYEVLRNSSGSLAILVAIRGTSSRVSSDGLAAGPERRRHCTQCGSRPAASRHQSCSRHGRTVSALPPKADIAQHGGNLC